MKAGRSKLVFSPDKVLATSNTFPKLFPNHFKSYFGFLHHCESLWRYFVISKWMGCWLTFPYSWDSMLQTHL